MTIDAAAGALEPVTRLASGNYDMGIADLNVLIKFRDDNPATPIKALFIVFDKPAYAIIARKSRGIAAPGTWKAELGAPSGR